KGTPGSVIGKSKEVKRYLSKKAEARKSQTGVEKMDKLMGSGVLGAVPIAIGAVASQIKKRKRS
uniref:hypothetical protein n=1 Tax=Salmonella sp. s60093 TaxID=3159721 RepID=UPI0039808D1F